jgi:hypothetical protein
MQPAPVKDGVSGLKTASGSGEGRGPRKFDNFYEEFEGVEVRVVLHNEKVLTGRVVESRRYWVKLMTDPSTAYYVNKAWILYVQPLKKR